MPLTFPSHSAIVLPVKMRWPRRFDGVALVVGSAAPDLPYVLGRPLLTYGRTWVGLVVWGVPLSAIAALLVRRAAPAVAAHLPGLLRDYSVLGLVRHRWYVTASSALAGTVSHRLWDEVTHHGIPGTVRRPKRFWTVLAGTLAAGSIFSALLPSGDVPVVLIIRLLGVFAVAALAAALAVELAGSRAKAS